MRRTMLTELNDGRVAYTIDSNRFIRAILFANGALSPIAKEVCHEVGLLLFALIYTATTRTRYGLQGVPQHERRRRSLRCQTDKAAPQATNSTNPFFHPTKHKGWPKNGRKAESFALKANVNDARSRIQKATYAKPVNPETTDSYAKLREHSATSTN